MSHAKKKKKNLDLGSLFESLGGSEGESEDTGDFSSLEEGMAWLNSPDDEDVPVKKPVSKPAPVSSDSTKKAKRAALLAEIKADLLTIVDKIDSLGG